MGEVHMDHMSHWHLTPSAVTYGPESHYHYDVLIPPILIILVMMITTDVSYCISWLHKGVCNHEIQTQVVNLYIKRKV